MDLQELFELRDSLLPQEIKYKGKTIYVEDAKPYFSATIDGKHRCLGFTIQSSIDNAKEIINNEPT